MINKKLNRILAVFVTGAILLSAETATNVYAETKASSSNKKLLKEIKLSEHKGKSWIDINKDLKAKLDPLVKAGTITEEQEDKIISYMKVKFDERKAEKNKVKNMTEAERKEYFESKSKGKPDMLKDLLNSNVINQAQADEIKKVLPIKHNKENNLKNKLDSAVKDGTITQSQEDKILVYFKQLRENRKVEMEKVKNMSEADRKAYFENKAKNGKADPFAELVKSGTITQQQADKLKSMLPSHSKGFKGDNQNNKTQQNN